MIYERIKKLCNENDISVNELEQKIGIAKGSLCKIDKHKPGLDKLQKLAIELNTTEKYILKGEESIKENFSSEMATLVSKIRNDKELSQALIKYFKLPKDKKEYWINTINMLSKE